VVLLLAGCAGSASPGGDEPGFVSGDRSIALVSPGDRQPAPVVQGARLGSDQTLSTADYSGRVVVLNVWGSWCPPCRAEAKDLEAASRETAGLAQFVGLNTKDYDPAPGLAFVRSFGVTYPQIFDPDGTVLVSLAGKLPPNAIPTTLVIDKQGRIAARIAGAVSKITLVTVIKDVAVGR
jgi:thiol-disulfide isomerase/thioredoxin